jgi:hypothetical protein
MARTGELMTAHNAVHGAWYSQFHHVHTQLLSLSHKTITQHPPQCGRKINVSQPSFFSATQSCVAALIIESGRTMGTPEERDEYSGTLSRALEENTRHSMLHLLQINTTTNPLLHEILLLRRPDNSIKWIERQAGNKSVVLCSECVVQGEWFTHNPDQWTVGSIKMETKYTDAQLQRNKVEGERMKTPQKMLEPPQ